MGSSMAPKSTLLKKLTQKIKTFRVDVRDITAASGTSQRIAKYITQTTSHWKSQVENVCSESQAQMNGDSR